MTKELKEKLELGLQAVGLDKGLSTFINIEKEEDVQGAIDNLLKLKTPQKSVEELIKDKEIQSEIDRRISEAKKSWESKLPEPPKKVEEGDTLDEKLAKLLDAKLSPLSEKLGAFEKNKAKEAKLAEARKLLSVSKLPEAIREAKLKYLNTESEQPLSEWVKEQEEEHQIYHQALVDQGVISGAPEKGYKPHTEMTESEAQAIVDRVKV